MNQARATCTDGKGVGFIGRDGADGSGTSTINRVTAAASGTCTLLIPCANADSVPRSAAVIINGGAPATVAFPIAGEDDDTVGVHPLSVTMNAGANSVTFSDPTGHEPDIVALHVKAG